MVSVLEKLRRSDPQLHCKSYLEKEGNFFPTEEEQEEDK